MKKSDTDDNSVSEKIYQKVFIDGLGDSTWRDNHPAAYSELIRHYKADVLHDIEVVLNKYVKTVS